MYSSFTDLEPKKNVFGEFNPINKNNMTTENLYKTSFMLLQKPTKNDFKKDVYDKAVPNLGHNSELSKIYFSDKNIERIQKMIKIAIFNGTQNKVRLDVNQDQKELVYVMQAIYTEHATFRPNEIIRQTKELNKLVIKEITPGIITSLRQNRGYLREINNPRNLLPLPVNVNNGGRQCLPGFSTIYEF